MAGSSPAMTRRACWFDSNGTCFSEISRPRRVVRAFARDGHVMHVALALARPGDTDELRLGLEGAQARRPDIAHGGAQAADQLMQHRGDRSLVRHLALD